MAYNTIQIQFDQSTPIADIQNYNRWNLTGSIERDRTEYLPLPSEISTRKFLGENGVYRIQPHYLLNLVGDTTKDLLRWRLEHPVYPLHYTFDCVFWAMTTKEEILNAVSKIRKLQYIEKVQV